MVLNSEAKKEEKYHGGPENRMMLPFKQLYNTLDLFWFFLSLIDPLWNFKNKQNPPDTANTKNQ